MARGRKPEPIRHGTIGGYQVHIRRKEKPCAECRSANNRYKHPRNKADRERGRCAPGLGWPLEARRG